MYYRKGKYPVDKHGVAIPVWDTEVPYLEDEKYSNHHYNFYARNFGSLAISQTFRDLESQQILLPDKSHVALHQIYSGIELPSPGVMLGKIEEDAYNDRKLSVYQRNLGRVSLGITNSHLRSLHSEYNSIVHML